MKRLFLIFAALLFGKAILAQQQPHYTQYVINNYILNPALAGIENYTDIKISHRHQWVGLQDAPVTSYFTFHTPIGKKDDRTTATSFETPDENPRGRNFLQDFQAAKPHHGIGVKIINDRSGPINRFAGYISYAYHIGLTAKTSLAAGFEAGIVNTSLDRSKLDFGLVNPLDPAVFNSGNINQLRPDFGAGLWLYGSDYFVGASVQQVIPQSLYFSGNKLNTQSKTIPHVFVSAGYRFLLDDDISMLPSCMVKFVYPAPVQIDINCKWQYRDLLWVGAGYRLKDGINAMLGLNVSNTFNVSYAYDYTTSALNTVSKGTHEIVLGFILGNKYGDWCPRNVW
jgi:type IX secretion system PorP/SprF family membrane protein